MPVISTRKIKTARTVLAALDPALAVAHATAPDFKWRVKEGGFPGLVKMVIEQQVSVAAANAIWARFQKGLRKVTPRTVLKRDIETLRTYGLSLPKAKYVHAIAEAYKRGHVDFEKLIELDDAAAAAALIAIKGVGRWTAEVYLMMCEGRSDVFPAGDLALQEALRMAENGKKRLTEKELYARAEKWKPHRGVAAHMLWAYYSHQKQAAKKRA